MRFYIYILIGVIFNCSSFVMAAESKAVWMDSDCGLLQKKSDLSAKETLVKFLNKAGNAEFLKSNPDFDALILCPNFQGGPDAFDVVGDYKIIAEKLDAKSAVYTVRIKKFGTLTSGGEKGNLNSFIPKQSTEEIKYFLEKTPFGWRIRFDTTYISQVTVTKAKLQVLERQWAPGEKEVFEKTVNDKK